MFSGFDDRDDDGQNEFTLLDDDVEQEFDDDTPQSVVVPCKQWSLRVKVTYQASIAPAASIKIRLDRIGYWTKRRKSSGDLEATHVLDGSPIVADFKGQGKQRYHVYVQLDSKDWFYWTSTRRDVSLDGRDSKEIEIEVQHRLVLISMEELATQKSRLRMGLDCAGTYGLTETVTAAKIRAIIGDEHLDKGGVDAKAIVTHAAALKNLLGFRAQPYFSAIDLNLSHQMSFFLACLAFEQYGRHRNKIIVNLDNHRDYAPSQRVMYDKWGSGFFQHAQLLKRFLPADRVVYTVLGEMELENQGTMLGWVRQLYYSDCTPQGQAFNWQGTLASEGFFADSAPLVAARKNGSGWDLMYLKEHIVPGQVYDDEDLEELVELNILEPLQSPDNRKVFELRPGPHSGSDLRERNVAVVKALSRIAGEAKVLDACDGATLLNEAYLGDLSKTDVYFTVDRDVTRGSFTYWGDGYLTCSQMRSTVKRCLKFLKSRGANLVGFDLSGLPDTDGKSKMLGLPTKGADPGQHADAIIDQTRDDIAYCLKQVLAYGR